MAPLGSAQSPAPFGCPPMRKSSFSRGLHVRPWDHRSLRGATPNPRLRLSTARPPMGVVSHGLWPMTSMAYGAPEGGTRALRDSALPLARDTDVGVVERTNR
eukprot:2012697-Prymnesium_polylepis.1